MKLTIKGLQEQMRLLSISIAVLRQENEVLKAERKILLDEHHFLVDQSHSLERTTDAIAHVLTDLNRHNERRK